MNTDIVILAAVNLKHPCPESFICFGQGCFFLKNKGDFGSIVSCDRTDSSVYYDADTGSWKNALSNAYTGIVMRLCLRMTIRTDRWDHHTSFERSFVWDAGNFSKCSMHGI